MGLLVFFQKEEKMGLGDLEINSIPFRFNGPPTLKDSCSDQKGLPYNFNEEELESNNIFEGRWTSRPQLQKSLGHE